MKRWPAGVLFGCAIALSLLRCANESPGGARAGGNAGEPCLSDGTCIGSLVCVNDRCRAVDPTPTSDARPPIVDAQPEAEPAGDADTGPPASCAALAPTCGGTLDCCVSAVVPGGGFNRSNNTDFPATLDAFRLNVYEVTVARFRAFVEAGNGTQQSPPAPGAGAHPKIANSGWSGAFTPSLPVDTTALKTQLKCDATFPAWTDAGGANENVPINCVTWFEAFAFCAWDGGRLPTEAEWNFAAAGGSEQRGYPWGSGNIDRFQASYDCASDDSGVGQCAFSDLLPVGTKSPAGDGKFGHADLAGNVAEWVLDTGVAPYIMPCNDCANVTAGTTRVTRGGGFPDASNYLTTSSRLDRAPGNRNRAVGFRCARSL